MFPVIKVELVPNDVTEQKKMANLKIKLKDQ